MREIKFRIPMFSDKGTFTEFQFLELGDDIEGTLCGYNGEPEQYTGFKDKNGKEIWEGDIVAVIICPLDVPKSYAHTSKCLVKWLDYGFVLTTGNECIGGVDFDFTINWDNDLEVIGNKWENPELIAMLIK